MLEKLLKFYIEILKIHIWTKTQDKVFHEFSWEVYKKLFDVFHLISEKFEDIDKWEYYCSLQTSKNRLYDVVEEVKELIDTEKDKHSTWMDDLIRWLVSDLEWLCWTARWFTEEMEDDIDEEEKIDNMKPYKKKLI